MKELTTTNLSLNTCFARGHATHTLSKSDIEQALKNYYSADDVYLYIDKDKRDGNDTVTAEIMTSLLKKM